MKQTKNSNLTLIMSLKTHEFFGDVVEVVLKLKQLTAFEKVSTINVFTYLTWNRLYNDWDPRSILEKQNQSLINLGA